MTRTLSVRELANALERVLAQQPNAIVMIVAGESEQDAEVYDCVSIRTPGWAYDGPPVILLTPFPAE